jgi:hypothetical protein
VSTQAPARTLPEAQAFFAHAIRQPVPVEAQPGAALVTPRLIAGNARLTPTEQLEIYREQFWLRHVDALEDDFATIVHLLGHDGFHALAERYLDAHPPLAFSLRDLGADVATFVATASPYAADPLIADCARIEWAFVEAFDAADANPVSAEAIAAIAEDAWPLARLTFHPALQLVALAHPAHDYRAAIKRGEDPIPRPAATPVHVAVYRGPETLQYVEVEPLAFDLLERLVRGERLGDACEQVAASVADGKGEELLEAKVGGWFQFWAASGWVTAIAT